MSPAQILERSYAAIKQLLLSGAFRGGQRIEASRLADELGVSITPVRDVLNRLTGEGLVNTVPGDGFYAPLLLEDGLVDLLRWNAHLAGHAVRHLKEGGMAGLDPGEGGYAERTARFFLALARQVGNAEFEHAMASANDRLMHVRQREPELLEGAELQLEALRAAGAAEDRKALAADLRHYHKRRERASGALVRLFRMTPPPG